MIKGDFSFLKNMNEQIVLNLIRERGIISSSELVNITGMRPSTIFNILKDLTSKSFILNLGKGQSSDKGGKRPFLWKINGEAAYVLGLHVEVGEIIIVVMNLEGEIIARNRMISTPTKYVDDLVNNITTSINSTINKYRIESDKVLGAGIALAGVVNGVEGIVITTDVVPNINFDLMTPLKKKLPFMTVLENNANAAALAAKWVGSGKSNQSFITLLPQLRHGASGLGVGIIINGELYRGKHHCAGEMNQSLPKVGDLLLSVKNKLSEGKLLREYINKPDAIDLDVIINAARENDKAALAYIEKLGHILGRIVSPAIALLNPETLVLSGKIAEFGDMIVGPIRRIIEMEVISMSSDNLDIVTSIYGSDSVCVGAASVILSHFFKVPIVSYS